MGSKILTKPTAATMLDVSERTIYRLMKQGVLRTETKGRNIYLVEEDVLKLKKIRLDGPVITINRDTIPMLVARVQTLENQVATLMRLLNVKYEALSLTDSEYKLLYDMAESYSLEGWPPHAEEQWADMFVRMKMEDLEKLEEVSGDKHPWRHILRLATSMHLNSYSKDLRDQFAAGRNNIHSVAGVWCTLKGESPKSFDLLLQRDTLPIHKLMKKLTKTRS